MESTQKTCKRIAEQIAEKCSWQLGLINESALLKFEAALFSRRVSSVRSQVLSEHLLEKQLQLLSPKKILYFTLQEYIILN